MKACWQENALSLDPSTHMGTDATDADEWRDYAIRGQFKVNCGTAFYVYAYYQTVNNWYRIKVDYENQAVTLQKSASTDSPMITDLATESRSLILNATYQYIFEINLDAKTRIPCVFYEDTTNGAIGTKWSAVSGVASYVGQWLTLQAGEEVRATEDVTGPCIEASDAIMDECGCAAITQPPTTQFDMSEYCTSFKVRNVSGSPEGLFFYKCHWNYTTGEGVKVTFNFATNQVTIDVIQAGSPTVVATNSGAAALADTVEYTLWIDAYNGAYTVWGDSAGTPVQIVTLTDATYSTGDFGFGSTTGTTGLKEIICVPRDSEDYDCPWLIWMKSNSVLQDRDADTSSPSSEGALDGQVIVTGEESTNFLRFIMGETEISANDRTYSEGSVYVGTASSTYLYLPVTSVTPIRTACRDDVAI